MEDEKYQVQIPANVKIRTVLINGIGIKELITTATAGVMSIFVAIPIYLLTQNYLVCLILVGIITGFTFIAVMKDKNNSCIAKLIINIYKYFKGQKFYKYVTKENDINEFVR